MASLIDELQIDESPLAKNGGALPEDRFCILLAVFNGQLFLEEQLRSLESQTVEHINIIASDDGSSDDSLAILEKWKANWSKGEFHIVSGPQKGFAENFRSLITGDFAKDADYVAFCDQDDIWLPTKLEIAAKALAPCAADGAALFCGRTLSIDEAGTVLGYSPKMSKPPSFKNALLQSIAGGNTMVMNKTASKFVMLASNRTSFVSHDWWSYMVVSGVGGKIIYDEQPYVEYRQHENNLVGAKTSWRARGARIRMTLAGRFGEWMDQNVSALIAIKDMLEPANRVVLTEWNDAREAGPFHVALCVFRNGLYRQSIFGNISFALAIILRKI